MRVVAQRGFVWEMALNARPDIHVQVMPPRVTAAGLTTPPLIFYAVEPRGMTWHAETARERTRRLAAEARAT